MGKTLASAVGLPAETVDKNILTGAVIPRAPRNVRARALFAAWASDKVNVDPHWFLTQRTALGKLSATCIVAPPV
jgi:hypothetical protein